MYRPILVTAPAAEVVTKDELKAHLRVNYDDEDSLIESYLDAAIAHVDGWSGILGRCLINQGWRFTFEAWSRRLVVPFPDVSQVVLSYYDTNNTLQTMDSANYQVLETSSGTVLEFYDNYTPPNTYQYRDDPVRATVTAGYGTEATSVPASIRVAIMLIAAHWFNTRESVAVEMSEVPMGASMLLGPHRRVGI